MSRALEKIHRTFSTVLSGVESGQNEKKNQSGCDSNNMRLVCTLMAVSFTAFQRK